MQSKNLENWKIFLLLDISIFVKFGDHLKLEGKIGRGPMLGSDYSSASKSFGSCKNVKYFVFQKVLRAESSTKITGGRKTP